MRLAWTLTLAVPVLFAVPAAAELPEGAEALHARLASRLAPSVRSWVGGEARTLARAGGDAGALRAAAQARFAGQLGAAGGADIEALAFLVLMQATRDAEADLKAIMAQVKAANAAKQKLRDLADKVRRDVAQNAGKRDNAPCRPPQCGVGRAALAEVAEPLAAARAPAGFAQREVATLRDLRALHDELKGKLDSLNQTSEMTSLRLQMLMDRRSKFISTLSNIMKKLASTQDAIVQNLK